MSLADELLADLEDGDEGLSVPQSAGLDDIDEEDQEEESEAMDIDLQVNSVRALAKLFDSDELTNIMSEINKRKTGSDDFATIGNKSQIDGPIESHPEYKLIVDANNVAVEIDHDITTCHKFAKERYSKRFPRAGVSYTHGVGLCNGSEGSRK